MTDAPQPESDRLGGAPHPRDAARVFGQEAAERAFLDAFSAGRLPHAWLLTGPRGVGKATLAWRIARFLLTQPAEAGGGLFGGDAPSPASLDTDPAHPVLRRIAAGSEGRLFLLRRTWDAEKKRMRGEITVDDARALKSFFALSAPDGGWRVVIVDAAEDMNPNAANALLKMLEEPPAQTVMLLVSHAPARLLPTIRSRCRTLPCRVLSPAEVAQSLAQAGIEADDPLLLAELAGGSAGAAVGLILGDGPGLYARIVGLYADAPQIDRAAALKIADAAGARGADDLRDLTLRLLWLFVARLARTGAGDPPGSDAAPGERKVLSRLAPDAAAGRDYADALQTLSARAEKALAVNLDPSGLILDMLLTLNQTAGTILSRR